VSSSWQKDAIWLGPIWAPHQYRAYVQGYQRGWKLWLATGEVRLRGGCRFRRLMAQPPRAQIHAQRPIGDRGMHGWERTRRDFLKQVAFWLKNRESRMIKARIGCRRSTPSTSPPVRVYPLRDGLVHAFLQGTLHLDSCQSISSYLPAYPLAEVLTDLSGRTTVDE
jgi:hypothetical protein